MKNNKALIAMFLLATILLIAGRHVFFISYMKTQKTMFRVANFKNNLSQTKTIEMGIDDLFKDKNGLVWKEHHKELVVDGKYHEVVFIQKKNNKALVFIIEDAEENHLFETFFSLQKSKTIFFVDLIKILGQLTFLNHTSDYLTVDFSLLKKTILNPLLNLQSFQTQLIKPPKALITM
jgi:hypothetical protein